MRISGIDYSLTSPAVCVHDGDEWSVDNCNFYYYDIKKRVVSYPNENLHPHLYPIWTVQEQRMDLLSRWSLDVVFRSDHIGLEGYSFGSKGRAVFNIAENGGILKHKLYKARYPVTEFAPTAVKKFATGKGNSGKDIMEESFKEETGKDIRTILELSEKSFNPISDIIDAYYVCKMTFWNVNNM